MLDLVHEYRLLLGKCASGAGVSVDEIDRISELEAAFAGDSDARGADGRRFRRTRVALPAVLRGGALHDAVTIAELTLGGLVVRAAPYAEVGAQVDLTIDDDAAGRSYRFKGVVRWVGDDVDDDFRLGIELVGAPVMLRHGARLPADPTLATLAA